VPAKKQPMEKKMDKPRKFGKSRRLSKTSLTKDCKEAKTEGDPIKKGSDRSREVDII